MSYNHTLCDTILPQSPLARFSSTSAPIPGNSSLDAAATLDILAQHGHFAVKEQPHRPKEAYLFHCPFHDDTEPSFALHEDKNQWHCWTCGGGGPAKMRELLGGGLLPRMDKPLKAPKPASKQKERPSGCTLAQLAEAKGLPLDFLKYEMGWFDSTFYGIPAVAMPYEHSTQLRVEVSGGRKCRWTNEGSPHNAKERYIVEPAEPTQGRRTALYVEGTTDCAAAKLIGLDVFVYGIPGTSTWGDKTGPMWAAEHQDDDVLVWQEPGEAGAKLAEKMAASLSHLRVIHGEETGYKDLCELVASYAGDTEAAKAYVEALIEDAEPYHQPLPGKADAGKADVGNRERENKDSFPITDIRSQSQLWEAMKAYFPLRPGMKPWTVARPMYNHSDSKGLIAEFPSNGWGNPANAQLKRQRLGFNMLPRMNGPQVYALKLSCDDWSPQDHEAISRRISRAIDKARDDDLGWVWFNNVLDRGYYLYLTSAPGVSGFEPVEGDIEPVLVDALKAIHPPGKEEPGRFRPYGGSDNWASRVEGTGEEDKDKWQIVAVSDGRADFIQAEAECIAAGVRYEYTKPYWRQQIGPGLEMRMPFREFMKLCASLGYSATRAGRLGLVESGEDDGEGEERVKAFAAAIDVSNPDAWDDEIIEGVL